MDNIFIRSIKLPSAVYAMTVTDAEGDFNIYVNSLVCPDKQKSAYQHELRHIKLDHFYDNEPVIINELQAK